MAGSLRRSLTLPIILGSASAALTLVMLIGWILVVVQNLNLTKAWADDTWLLVAGIVSFLLIASLIITLIVFLVREILEVHRHTSFLDSVTHELRSPLASLRLGLETLSRQELTAGQRSEVQERMASDLERLGQFINDLLQANRVSHGWNAVSVADIPVRELVEECMERIRIRYALPDSGLRNEVPEQLVFSTDRTALETILTNLLDNAVKYSTDAVEVRVHTERPSDKRVCLYIEDKGIGIPRSHLKRVHERFYRVPEVAVQTRRGTGLGLFVVANLVRSLNGKLRVRSAGLGHGTNVQVSFPARLILAGHP